MKRIGEIALTILLLPLYIITAPLWIALLVMYVRYVDQIEAPGSQWQEAAWREYEAMR